MNSKGFRVACVLSQIRNNRKRKSFLHDIVVVDYLTEQRESKYPPTYLLMLDLERKG